MNSLLKAAGVIAIGCFIGQMSGCASSNLVNIWHNPQAPALHKVLVVAVRKDATKRRIWEDAFSGELAKHGVAATSSYSLFPDTLPDSGQVITTLEGNSFDGILVIRRLPTEKSIQYVHGYTTTEQDVTYSYWHRYDTYFREIYHPGYIDSQTVAVSSIDVSTTGNGGQLIWSATSKTPDPATVTDAQKRIANLVINELAKQNIVGLKK